MNFGESNAPGGASHLINVIKAFIGSGIKNRIIAIFDNDTAAADELRKLEGLSIPDNVKVMKYPDIEFARNYPTEGPSGIHNLDVNGLACSIEMYFGDDILRDNGRLTPIQWTGFNSGLRRYQGEILDKKKLLKNFQRKLKKCEEDDLKLEQMDWQPIRLIWYHIFDAFS
jgi:hypothetical protein